jgi:hypothetical protein
MVRLRCAEKRNTIPAMKELGDWLDAHMPESLHEIVDVDQMLPNLVYSTKVPMNDEHWLNYNQALAYFDEARTLHDLLAKGKNDFDQVTRVS